MADWRLFAQGRSSDTARRKPLLVALQYELSIVESLLRERDPVARSPGDAGWKAQLHRAAELLQSRY